SWGRGRRLGRRFRRWWLRRRRVQRRGWRLRGRRCLRALVRTSMRWLRHLFTPYWLTQRRFGRAACAAIERAVADVESRHAGEIRVAIETALDLGDLYFGVSARARALAVF